MRTLSALLLLTASLIAFPAPAADRTETIPLKFLSAPELEQWLTLSSSFGRYVGSYRGISYQEPKPDADGKRAASMIPEGIDAWVADARKNTLTLTGSREAREQLKQVVRLLDVPARQVRVSVRLLKLEPAQVAELQARPNRVTTGDVTYLPRLDAEDRKSLESRATVLTTTLNVANNRTIFLQIPADAGQPLRQAALTPRVNGDGSVTVIAPGLVLEKPDRGAQALLYRAASGESRLVFDSLDRVWLLTLTVLPDASR